MEEVHAAWQGRHAAWLNEPSPSRVPVQLDGRDVTAVDTAGLQLLTCLVVDLARRGRAWSWLGASEALQRGAESLGLASVLSLPSPSPQHRQP